MLAFDVSQIHGHSLSQHDIHPIIVDELLIDRDVDVFCNGKQPVVIPSRVYSFELLRDWKKIVNIHNCNGFELTRESAEW